MLKGKWITGNCIAIAAIAAIAPVPKLGATATPTPTEELGDRLPSPVELSEPEVPPLGIEREYLPSATPEEAQTHYGHYSYSVAPRRELVSVGNGQRLRREAAAQFREMVAAAAADGVQLVPLSGFRDRDTQSYLFYGKARQRGQSLQQRANVSAPPGYSEHHTGYAIDIGDASAPQHHVRRSFHDTDAFRWLKANAGEFGFEMSFPRQHPEINYEPWHWRWVGSARSQRVFRAARP
ncbi:M15 family metallopeptidase [Phormidium sp. CCY1219]|uniref:M15 family metallopeptidase n=1 Tax=Phormidium sp. CCY1219 TaxID=2886104 RepID=UPI002D1F03A1|nr:M15 family metallopeptidase [Phormidium sp. CCY1219]MEB3829235.1 D-alanyl-D-alanine carboxypeptidase family protein [Phormidium sp. CCY1219]